MNPNKPKVVVCHPGRQHSHQAAMALQQAGMLAGYWTGIPCIKQHQGFIPDSIWRKFIRYSTVDLDPKRVCWYPLSPILNKTGANIFPITMAKEIEYFGYRQFDRWAAAKLNSCEVNVVIAYENSARETFRIAKRKGIKTVLDAAAFHHDKQDETSPFIESVKLHRKINYIKDEEINFADRILTVSNLARDSYLKAGVPENKICSVPVGADTLLFKRSEDGIKNTEFIFLYVGISSVGKGVDVLLQAFDKLRQLRNDLKLKMIGGKSDASDLVNKNKDKIDIINPMSQNQLVRHYQTADCLILPSRHDSYGMVVAEALACGIPVIVSDMVGAKELVQEGKNGWVVPANNVNALFERMSWCVNHHEEVERMKGYIRANPADVSWDRYHKRLIEVLQSMEREEDHHRA